jgi:hypothetical protein
MDQNKQQDLDRPNQAANKEPAEGSRENAGGITNRPLEREQQEQDEVPPRGHTKAEDVGRTSGGGSLGHDQPDDVKRDTPLRNATGSDRDPVMPADDATLKTKI